MNFRLKKFKFFDKLLSSVKILYPNTLLGNVKDWTTNSSISSTTKAKKAQRYFDHKNSQKHEITKKILFKNKVLILHLQVGK